ncbi:MAG: preprotein translocase subunit SecE [Acidobacteria bacterium]|nr:preprotein translocase subunit SecE [Acidobacteriota bacterium]
MVNRATKRLLAKQQAAQDRQQARRQPAARGGGGGGTREAREPFRRRTVAFVKEARNELRKVAWPSRGEVLTYTVVVLVSVTFITLVVFGFDFAFGKSIFRLYGR